VGAVVHDTLVIIADTIIGDSAIIIFVEVMFLTCKKSLKFYLCIKSIHPKNTSVDIVSDMNSLSVVQSVQRDRFKYYEKSQ